jgi:hypothetical protein
MYVYIYKLIQRKKEVKNKKPETKKDKGIDMIVA